MSREITFPRVHLVYSARNKLAQTHEGMGARSGRIGVVRGAGVADQSERRSCLALDLRRAYDATTPDTGGR